MFWKKVSIQSSRVIGHLLQDLAGPSECLQKLIVDILLPRAFCIDIYAFKALVYSSKVQWALSKCSKNLSRIFDVYRLPHGNTADSIDLKVRIFHGVAS